MSTSKITLLWLLSCCGVARAEVVHFDHGPSLVVQRPGLYPETIEYDRKNQRFLLGSFREGAVYAVDGSGAASVLVDDRRLCSVLGLAVDVERGRLWVVNADVGSSARPSQAGPRRLAAVVVYDLSTGAPLGYHDLGALVPGPHLLNGIALDRAGNAYVTDSFSPAIYKVALDGTSTVLVRDPRFAGEGVNLNGLVVHPDGYLLVVKKSDGALFKVPLDQPARFTRVDSPRAFVGGDGLLLVDNAHLILVANRTTTAAIDAAFSLTSDDGWATAKLTGTAPLGDVYPTTAVVRDGKVYVVHSKLDELVGAAPEKKALLRRQAEVQQIATIEAPPGIRRTLLGREPSHQPGWETRLYLIEYPPGAKAPPHLHSEPGVGWVVDGEFESAFADQPVVRGQAGQSFVELAGLPHRLFRNPSADHPLRFVVAYTLRAGEQPFSLLP